MCRKRPCIAGPMISAHSHFEFLPGFSRIVHTSFDCSTAISSSIYSKFRDTLSLSSTVNFPWIHWNHWLRYQPFSNHLWKCSKVWTVYRVYQLGHPSPWIDSRSIIVPFTDSTPSHLDSWHWSHCCNLWRMVTCWSSEACPWTDSPFAVVYRRPSADSESADPSTRTHPTHPLSCHVFPCHPWNHWTGPVASRYGGCCCSSHSEWSPRSPFSFVIRVLTWFGHCAEFVECCCCRVVFRYFLVRIPGPDSSACCYFYSLRRFSDHCSSPAISIAIIVVSGVKVQSLGSHFFSSLSWNYQSSLHFPFSIQDLIGQLP